MQPDDELCLCFHVTRRKVESYLRVERPRRVGQLADCFGAGTGCGWCRPFLQRLFDAAQASDAAELPAADEYARDRSRYVRAGGGTPPPGATPPAPAEDSPPGAP
ncbi:MAG: (2Fe-2S)-binding protein [Pirellulales bacterium]|nr:(2Fe-2S)-binding protein [Pirellulales bacterium]MBX3434670.1 (2Fe-2S)-binding protein [Pirellulales bacterium]